MATRLAPAKINLFLDVVRRREDKFHELHTAFLAVSLCDKLSAEPASTFSLEVDGEYARFAAPGNKNLVEKAVRRLAMETGGRLPPVRVRLTKNIPVYSGLGGGSSDATATLLLLDEVFGLGLGVDRLEHLSAQIGSDCAFFVRGGAAEGRGRGEILTPLPLRQLWILLVIPPLVVPTREAYAALAPESKGARSDAAGLRHWLQDGGDFPQCLYNTFEPALDVSYREFAEVRQFLREQGAFFARLSGSGSASFGLFETRKARDTALERVPREWRAFACETHGLQVKEIGDESATL